MEAKKLNLSVALAVYNESAKLRVCLSSVSPYASEIIIVDGGSTDDTVDIAKEFGARVIRTDNPLIFHINKQKALDECRFPWILQLDADEAVSKELWDEIGSAIKQNKDDSAAAGYYIPRKNFFLGGWMKKGGQYPDYVIRLFRRGKGRFPCKSVHEQIDIDGKVGYLTQPLLHYSFRSLSEYWQKAFRYSELAADSLGLERPSPIQAFLLYLLAKPFMTFWNLYVRHLGVLDGWRGFLFAALSALQFPLAYFSFAKHAYGKGIN